MYVGKDMRIHGYFSKAKGIYEQRALGNTGSNKNQLSHCCGVKLSRSRVVGSRVHAVNESR
jgi:hypothetical protein